MTKEHFAASLLRHSIESNGVGGHERVYEIWSERLFSHHTHTHTHTHTSADVFRSDAHPM